MPSHVARPTGRSADTSKESNVGHNPPPPPTRKRTIALPCCLLCSARIAMRGAEILHGTPAHPKLVLSRSLRPAHLRSLPRTRRSLSRTKTERRYIYARPPPTPRFSKNGGPLGPPWTDSRENSRLSLASPARPPPSSPMGTDTVMKTPEKQESSDGSAVRSSGLPLPPLRGQRRSRLGRGRDRGSPARAAASGAPSPRILPLAGAAAAATGDLAAPTFRPPGGKPPDHSEPSAVATNWATPAAAAALSGGPSLALGGGQFHRISGELGSHGHHAKAAGGPPTAADAVPARSGRVSALLLRRQRLVEPAAKGEVGEGGRRPRRRDDGLVEAVAEGRPPEGARPAHRSDGLVEVRPEDDFLETLRKPDPRGDGGG